MNEPNGLTTRELIIEIREDLAALRNEMRGRFHDWQRTWGQLENRVRDLEEFRRWSEDKHRRAEERAERYVPLIEELISEDKITEAVGEAMQKAEARGWSRRERWMAYGLFVFAALGAVGTLFTILAFLRIIHAIE